MSSDPRRDDPLPAPDRPALDRAAFDRPALDRRAFLGLLGAAGAGLILGAGGAWADEQEAKKAWDEARARMKQGRLDGVVVVIPKDPRARAALAEGLSRLIEVNEAHGPAPAAAPYLLSCVWVCATAAQVGAKEGETLVLLDPQGKRLAGAALDLAAKDALARVAELVDGKQGERRAARVARVRQDRELARALDDLVKNLSSGSGYQTLAARFDEAAPALVDLHARAKDADELKGLLAHQLGNTYWQRLRGVLSFPFGVEWKVELHEPEPCPPCGMAMPSISGRKFVRFLTE